MNQHCFTVMHRRSVHICCETEYSTRKSRDMFVTVDEVANAHMKELEAIYPVLNGRKGEGCR